MLKYGFLIFFSCLLIFINFGRTFCVKSTQLSVRYFINCRLLLKFVYVCFPCGWKSSRILENKFFVLSIELIVC